MALTKSVGLCEEQLCAQLCGTEEPWLELIPNAHCILAPRLASPHEQRLHPAPAILAVMRCPGQGMSYLKPNEKARKCLGKALCGTLPRKDT